MIRLCMYIGKEVPRPFLKIVKKVRYKLCFETGTELGAGGR